MNTLNPAVIEKFSDTQTVPENRIVVRGNQYLRYGTVQVQGGGEPAWNESCQGGSRGKVGKTFLHPLTFVRIYLMGLFAFLKIIDRRGYVEVELCGKGSSSEADSKKYLFWGYYVVLA